MTRHNLGAPITNALGHPVASWRPQPRAPPAERAEALLSCGSIGQPRHRLASTEEPQRVISKKMTLAHLGGLHPGRIVVGNRRQRRKGPPALRLEG